ncbi:hypothetical protein ACM614_00465 [Streptomyces sp. 12297]
MTITRPVDRGLLQAVERLVAIGPQLGMPLPLQLGTIPAERAVTAARATVRTFFDAQLRGRPDTANLLMGASPRHPEIQYIAGR